MKHRLLPLWLVLLTLAMIMSIVPTLAQNQVIISVVVPEFLIDGFTEDAIAQFESQYPNIKVHIKPAQTTPSFSPQLDVESYLDSINTYVSEGDVLFISSSQFSTEATRAGYLLDLSPLVNSDVAFNADDFYYPVWQSFQWDGAIWGVPAAADVIGLAYDPVRFDTANLPYPDSWFTMDDIDLALRELVTYDDEGAVEIPALIDLSNGLDSTLIALMGGQKVVDDTQLPSVPDYSNPQLVDLLEAWSELQTDGIVPAPGSGFQFAAQAPVFIVQSLFTASPAFGGVGDLSIAPLPGGYVGLTVNGLAVSSGTQYPQEAYEFIKYVSNDPQLSNSFLGVVPARRSLAGIEPESQGAIASLLNPSDEVKALVENYIDFAISPTDTRYGSFLALAIAKVSLEGIDAPTAIQEVEQDVLDRLQVADDRSAEVDVIVATPPPEIILAEGQVALKFGINSFTVNIANQEAWDAAIADFVDNDPEVSDITLQPATIFTGNSLTQMADRYDCFYTTGNIVQNGDPTLLRNIDPLLASDLTMDVNDFVAGTINNMTRENLIYGLPLEIQPETMVYDSLLIEQGGAFPPYAGWTVTDFENILRTLKVDPEDPAPFRSDGFGGGTYLYNLIAAYGGAPLDYRTQPLSINFTDPTSVEAIRQVLDLAKDGYIDYTEQLDFTGAALAGNDTPVPLFTQYINAFSFDALNVEIDTETASGQQVPIAFPRGNTFSAVNYDMVGLYISSKSDFAEPCYRFISAMSSNPNIPVAMPARMSVINDPTLATVQNPQSVALYHELADILAEPNTIPIPTGFANSVEGTGDTLLILWLARAFDRYVLEDADLEVELEDAQLYSQSYRECAALIPPFDPEVDQSIAYFGKFFDCVDQVDPSMGELLPDF